MKNFNTFAPRLLAGFGTAALVAGVGLFASSRPAHTAGGPIPVDVANTVPVNVGNTVQAQNVDNPDKQPYMQQTLVTTSAGSLQGEGSFLVPAGKRLVIETVALDRDQQSSATAVQLYISTKAGTAGSLYGVFPVLIVGTAGIFPGVTQSLHVRADPGTPVSLQVNRTGGTGNDQEVDDVTVYGYLVNVP